MTSVNYFKLGLLLIATGLFTNCEKDPVEPENEGNGDVYHHTYGVNDEGYTTEIYIHFDDEGEASRDLKYRIEYK
jgi:hypothetical protein